jgi:hypothetical protein
MAYAKLWNDFKDDMSAAVDKHKDRQQVIDAKFFNVLNKATADFGCDNHCMKMAFDHVGARELERSPYTRRRVANKLSKCKCGDGVVKITNTPVNSMALVKEEYGDLNTLSEQELLEFHDHVLDAKDIIQ